MAQLALLTHYTYLFTFYPKTLPPRRHVVIPPPISVSTTWTTAFYNNHISNVIAKVERAKNSEDAGDPVRIAEFYGQRERCPDTGREHLQACWRFTAGVRWRQSLRIMDADGAHVEPCRDFEDSKSYCSRAGKRMHDTNAISFRATGTGSGHRSDWRAIYQLVRSGESDRTIADAYPGQFVRNYRGIERLRQIHVEPRKCDRPARTIVIYGESGTGKTRFALKHCPKAYWLTCGSRRAQVQWWDDYNGETTIILDEFRGSLRYEELIGMLDTKPFRVQRKGDSVHLQATDFLILSNFHPEDWYAWVNFDGSERHCKEALRRRICLYRRIRKGNIMMNIPEVWL